MEINFFSKCVEPNKVFNKEICLNMHPIKTMDHKSLKIWDNFRGQQSQITDVLDNYNLVTIMVPNNLTHLLQSLDLTTNDYFKNIAKAAFRDYFTNTITKEFQIDPDKDVTTIKVDLKFITLQIHPPQSDNKYLSPLQK